MKENSKDKCCPLLGHPSLLPGERMKLIARYIYIYIYIRQYQSTVGLGQDNNIPFLPHFTTTTNLQTSLVPRVL